MAGLASKLTSAVRARTKLDEFRDGLQAMSVPAKPLVQPMPKPLPTGSNGLQTGVAQLPGVHWASQGPTLPQQASPIAQPRIGALFGQLGGLASRGLGQRNALAPQGPGRGPFNWLASMRGR